MVRESRQRGGREGPSGPPTKEPSAHRGATLDRDDVQVRSALPLKSDTTHAVLSDCFYIPDCPPFTSLATISKIVVPPWSLPYAPMMTKHDGISYIS